MPRVVINLKPKHNGGYSHVNVSQRTCVTSMRASTANAQRNGSPPARTCRSRSLRPDTWSGRQRYKAALRASGQRAREAGLRLPASRHLHSQANGTLGLVKRHEDAPGAPERWWLRGSGLLDDLEELAPTAVRTSADSRAVWDWLNSAEARPRVRPIIADEAQTAQFLASEGLELNNEARGLFLDMVQEEFLAAVKLLERRAKRDYGPDARIQSFPKFELDKRLSVDGLSPWQLFEAWVEKRKPAPATINRWRVVFLDMDKHFAGRAAGSLKDDETFIWAQQLVTDDRGADTVNDVWCNAAHTVFKWAVKQRKISSNPFDDVAVTTQRKVSTRQSPEFNETEVQLILRTASAYPTNSNREFDVARRWVPWICAYTGARAGEITQLRGKDVSEHEGTWVIHITPEAGTVKTGKPRTVPLHDHLIEQGFSEFVKAKGDGPLFYNTRSLRKAITTDPTKPVRPRSVSTRNRIAEWVREIGVTDTAVAPNHSWRHTFKRRAARAGIEPRIRNGMCGHAPHSVADEYETPSTADLIVAMKKFPRYELSLEKHEDGK